MTKNTLSVSKLPQFEENPFVEVAIQQIDDNTVKKTQFINGNKGVENLVINQDGEVIAQSKFVRFIEVDEERFAKLYLSQFETFWELSKTAIRVFGYIVNNLIPNKDVVYIDMQDILKYTNYKEEKSIYKGIAELVNAGIIARSTSFIKYFINPMVFFNGDRITFATTYIRQKQLTKGKKKKYNDPNQLNLLDIGKHIGNISSFEAEKEES
jgi:hypothetical protein